MKEHAKPPIVNYYIARSADGSVVHEGFVTSEQVVTTGQDELVIDITENDHLARLSAHVDKFPPLPGQGETIEADQLYVHQGAVVRARQTHIRTEHANLSTIPSLFVAHQPGKDYVDWIPNERVALDTIRTHAGVTYRARQAHVTQAGRAPPATPSLWMQWIPPPRVGR